MSGGAIEPENAAVIHRVVVGVDGSAASDRALEWAVAEALRTGAVLEAHTSYEPGYVFVSNDEVQMSMDKILGEAATRAADAAPGVAFTGVKHDGIAAKDLIEASQNADLLVVGSRGRGGFKGLLLGSVSQQCALHAHCPVVIVRPPEGKRLAGDLP
jgi:nucleotide-binding universal stress UspA family protein